MSLSDLNQLLGDERRNAAVSWVIVALLAAVWIVDLVLGETVVGEFLWAVFALALLALALIPPLAYRSRYVMLPWEILLLAALPVVGLAVGTDQFTGHFAAYFAAAAVALLMVVELQAFTTVRMSPEFALVLVVAATMAAAALWALLQWGFDYALGTSFITTNDDLMWEFVYSVLAGLAAGVVFTAYFRRAAPGMEERLPPEVDAEVSHE